MRGEGVGAPEGLLPWTLAGASSWSCSFVRIKKAKGGFKCERASEKKEIQKRGEKSWDLIAWRILRKGGRQKAGIREAAEIV